MKTMKKLRLIALSTVLLFAFSFTSCKYEEGPTISLRPKNERIANTWVIDKAYHNGEEVTDEYDQYELYLTTDNKASLTVVYSGGTFTFEYNTSGVWAFANSKEELVLDFEDDEADRTYEILRLAEKELWLKEKGGDTELQLQPK